MGALATMIFLPIVTLLLTHWASVGRVDFEHILPDTSTCSSADDDSATMSTWIWNKALGYYYSESVEDDDASCSI